MRFKEFVEKATKGEITRSDMSGIAHFRVPAAEGYARTIGGRAAPAYGSMIEPPTDDQRAAVERAMKAAG
jgi:hypothetical protein